MPGAVFPGTANLQEAMLTGITIGICVPSSCNRQAIVLTIRTLFRNDNITENDLLCSNDAAGKQKNLTSGAIATCVVLSLLGFLVLIGTMTDYILTSRHQSGVHASSHVSQSDLEVLIDPTPRNEFLAQFSAIRTLRHIFTMKKKQ